jgi:hypothetical protein
MLPAREQRRYFIGQRRLNCRDRQARRLAGDAYCPTIRFSWPLWNGKERRPQRGERKRIAAEVSKADWVMSKPGGDPSSGIGSGDVLRLPEWHPACRRPEAQPGSCTECKYLHGDAKG